MTPWTDHVLSVVDGFLETVVVVDDRAFIDREGLREPETTETHRGRLAGRGVAELRPPSDPDEHDLDGKAVTDAFAKDGLVCTLLSPKKGEEVREKFLRVARRADLVVLDWVLDRDEGRVALDLIGRILTDDDQPTRRRLRTIAVYTGQKDLRGIAAEIRGVLTGVYSDCELLEEDDGLTMTKGPVRAAVFAKEHVELPTELEVRRVAFADLPTRLRVEFASLASGLVTTVALAALAALREDTHRILRMLGPSLDCAFLGHRVALPVPADAQSHAVALVLAEFRAVVEDNDVGQHVAAAVIDLWLRDPDRRPKKFGTLIDENKALTQEQVESLVRVGLGTPEGCETVASGRVSKTHLSKKVKPEATKVFAASIDDAVNSDNEFGNRMTTRTFYSKPHRTLHLGVVVRTGEVYRVCVQPDCDSVRLIQRRSFPFLSLTEVEAGEPSHFVVRGDGPKQYVRLRLGTNPRNITAVNFESFTDGVVRAVEHDGRYVFTDAEGEGHLWVGELKPDFAQKVAVDLAREFSQVGVDEPELFRLSRG
ncbi:MAG TPA: response regulator receiver domain [Actinomycetota bacterium]|nr:response regulator receiver domain [Actinomycetota bacterium]